MSDYESRVAALSYAADCPSAIGPLDGYLCEIQLGDVRESLVAMTAALELALATEEHWPDTIPTSPEGAEILLQDCRAAGVNIEVLDRCIEPINALFRFVKAWRGGVA